MVGLVVGTSLLAACTGGGGGAEEGASEAPSSSPSSPVVSSSSEAAVPVLPDEARGDDDAAAVAFVEHWVELVNYAIATGDTAPARATSPDCEACGVLLDYIAGSERLGEGFWTLRDLTTRPPSSDDPAPSPTVVAGQVSIEGSKPDPFGATALGLTTSDDGWRVQWLLNEPY
ncbi:MAG: DUF6318 family protein [Nocardioides alkalitolerans]